MRHILFINSNFLHTPSANGQCTYFVMKELQQRDHSISCISTQKEGLSEYEIIDNIDIYIITESYYSKLLSKFNSSNRTVFTKFNFFFSTIIRRLIGLLLLPVFPNVNPKRSNKIFKLAEKIHKKNKIDCVIGVFRPFDGIKAAVY